MNKSLGLLFVLLIILSNCRKDEIIQQKCDNQSKISYSDIIDSLGGTMDSMLIVNVIDASQCFLCNSCFMDAVKIFRNIDHVKVVYIFSHIRPVAQQEFLFRNFHMNLQEFNILFNSTYFTVINKHYHTHSSSFLLIVDKSETIKIAYDKSLINNLEHELNQKLPSTF